MEAGVMRRVSAGLFAAGLFAMSWPVTAASAQPAEAPVEISPSKPAPSIDAPAAVPHSSVTLPPTRDANRVDTPAETLEKAGAVIKDLAKGDVHALRRGPLLIHGNYCGIGDRPVLPPVDALDAACMHHDACTKAGALPSCACDERLQSEATAIADDPASTPDLKALAVATAASMAVLICK